MAHKDKAERREYARRYYLAGRQKFIESAHEYKKTHTEERLCPKCSIAFRAPSTEIKRGRGVYCSKSCTPTWNKGIKGRQPWMDLSGLQPHPETQFKKGSLGFNRRHSEATRKKISMIQQGVAEAEWTGFSSPANRLIRGSLEYRRWRTQVFTRDNYTCQFCGVIGGYLEADHIQPFAYFPDLRFELSNGRTLCKSCHEKTDTYRVKRRQKCV